MSRRPQPFLRAVSLLLLVSFFFQEVSFANPDLSLFGRWVSDDGSKAWAKKFLPSIPESVATLESAWKSPDSKQTIILIQDAHTNDSAQMNLAKTLDALMSDSRLNGNEKSWVFVEGGFGDDSLSYLRQAASLHQRKQIAQSYLRQGLLHGQEYLDMTSEHNFKIWGVEDRELYQKSLEAYRAVAKERGKFEAYLNQIENSIKTLKPRILNPWLLSLDQTHEKYLKDQLSLTDYLTSLMLQAKIRDISLKNYSNLHKLRKLKKLEARLNAHKVSERHKNAIVKRLLRSSKFLNFDALLAEQKTLETEVYANLIQNADETGLLHCAETLRVLKKLLRFGLTPDEFKKFSEFQDVDLAHLTGFLNKKIMDRGEFYDSAVFYQAEFNDVVKRAMEFYELTLQRDQKFVANAIVKMDANHAKQAALITGGYHAENLKSLLKSKNISYISLRPQVLKETNQKRYEKILLNQKIVSAPTKASFIAGMLNTLSLADTALAPVVAARLARAPMRAESAALKNQSEPTGARLAGKSRLHGTYWFRAENAPVLKFTIKRSVGNILDYQEGVRFLRGILKAQGVLASPEAPGPFNQDKFGLIHFLNQSNDRLLIQVHTDVSGKAAIFTDIPEEAATHGVSFPAELRDFASAVDAEPYFVVTKDGSIVFGVQDPSVLASIKEIEKVGKLTRADVLLADLGITPSSGARLANNQDRKKMIDQIARKTIAELKTMHPTTPAQHDAIVRYLGESLDASSLATAKQTVLDEWGSRVIAGEEGRVEDVLVDAQKQLEADIPSRDITAAKRKEIVRELVMAALSNLDHDGVVGNTLLADLELDDAVGLREFGWDLESDLEARFSEDNISLTGISDAPLPKKVDELVEKILRELSAYGKGADALARLINQTVRESILPENPNRPGLEQTYIAEFGIKNKADFRRFLDVLESALKMELGNSVQMGGLAERSALRPVENLKVADIVAEVYAVLISRGARLATYVDLAQHHYNSGNRDVTSVRALRTARLAYVDMVYKVVRGATGGLSREEKISRLMTLVDAVKEIFTETGLSPEIVSHEVRMTQLAIQRKIEMIKKEHVESEVEAVGGARLASGVSWRSAFFALALGLLATAETQAGPSIATEGAVYPGGKRYAEDKISPEESKRFYRVWNLVVDVLDSEDEKLLKPDNVVIICKTDLNRFFEANGIAAPEAQTHAFLVQYKTEDKRPPLIIIHPEAFGDEAHLFGDLSKEVARLLALLKKQDIDSPATQQRIFEMSKRFMARAIAATEASNPGLAATLYGMKDDMQQSAEVRGEVRFGEDYLPQLHQAGQLSTTAQKILENTNQLIGKFYADNFKITGQRVALLKVPEEVNGQWVTLIDSLLGFANEAANDMLAQGWITPAQYEKRRSVFLEPNSRRQADMDLLQDYFSRFGFCYTGFFGHKVSGVFLPNLELRPVSEFERVSKNVELGGKTQNLSYRVIKLGENLIRAPHSYIPGLKRVSPAYMYYKGIIIIRIDDENDAIANDVKFWQKQMQSLKPGEYRDASISGDYALAVAENLTSSYLAAAGIVPSTSERELEVLARKSSAEIGFNDELTHAWDDKRGKLDPLNRMVCELRSTLGSTLLTPKLVRLKTAFLFDQAANRDRDNFYSLNHGDDETFLRNRLVYLFAADKKLREKYDISFTAQDEKAGQFADLNIETQKAALQHFHELSDEELLGLWQLVWQDVESDQPAISRKLDLQLLPKIYPPSPPKSRWPKFGVVAVLLFLAGVTYRIKKVASTSSAGARLAASTETSDSVERAIAGISQVHTLEAALTLITVGHGTIARETELRLAPLKRKLHLTGKASTATLYWLLVDPKENARRTKSASALLADRIQQLQKSPARGARLAETFEHLEGMLGNVEFKPESIALIDAILSGGYWASVILALNATPESAEANRLKRLARIGGFTRGIILHGEKNRAGVYVAEKTPRLIRDKSPEVNQRQDAKYEYPDLATPEGRARKKQVLKEKLGEELGEAREEAARNNFSKALDHLANLHQALLEIRAVIANEYGTQGSGARLADGGPAAFASSKSVRDQGQVVLLQGQSFKMLQLTPELMREHQREISGLLQNIESENNPIDVSAEMSSEALAFDPELSVIVFDQSEKVAGLVLGVELTPEIFKKKFPAAAFPSAKAIYFSKLSVSPEWQGSNLSMEIVKQLYRNALNAGYSEGYFRVADAPKSARAIAFYARGERNGRVARLGMMPADFEARNPVAHIAYKVDLKKALSLLGGARLGAPRQSKEAAELSASADEEVAQTMNPRVSRVMEILKASGLRINKPKADRRAKDPSRQTVIRQFLEGEIDLNKARNRISASNLNKVQAERLLIAARMVYLYGLNQASYEALYEFLKDQHNGTLRSDAIVALSADFLDQDTTKRIERSKAIEIVNEAQQMIHGARLAEYEESVHKVNISRGFEVTVFGSILEPDPAQIAVGEVAKSEQRVEIRNLRTNQTVSTTIYRRSYTLGQSDLARTLTEILKIAASREINLLHDTAQILKLAKAIQILNEEDKTYPVLAVEKQSGALPGVPVLLTVTRDDSGEYFRITLTKTNPGVREAGQQFGLRPTAILPNLPMPGLTAAEAWKKIAEDLKLVRAKDGTPDVAAMLKSTEGNIRMAGARLSGINKERREVLAMDGARYRVLSGLPDGLETMIEALSRRQKLGGLTISVSFDNKTASLVSFSEMLNNKLRVYINGDVAGTIDIQKNTAPKAGEATVGVSDLVQILRRVNNSYGNKLSPNLTGKLEEYFFYLDEYKGLPQELQTSMLAADLMAARKLSPFKIHLVSRSTDDNLKPVAERVIQSMELTEKEKTIFDYNATCESTDSILVHRMNRKMAKSFVRLYGDRERIILTEDILTEEGKANMFAPLAVTSLMKKVAGITYFDAHDGAFEDAYDLFCHLITDGQRGGSQTILTPNRDAFILFLRGKSDLVLPPALSAIDINLAIRVAGVGARMAAQSA